MWMDGCPLIWPKEGYVFTLITFSLSSGDLDIHGFNEILLF